MLWESSLANKIYKSKKFSASFNVNKLKDKHSFIENVQLNLQYYSLKDYNVSSNGCIFTIDKFNGAYYFNYKINSLFNLYINLFNTEKDKVLSHIEKFANIDIKNIKNNLFLILNKYNKDIDKSTNNLNDLLYLLQRTLLKLLLSKTPRQDIIDFIKHNLSDYLSKIDINSNKSDLYLLTHVSPTIYDIILISIILENIDEIINDNNLEIRKEKFNIIIYNNISENNNNIYAYNYFNTFINNNKLDIKKLISYKENNKDTLLKETNILTSSSELISAVKNRDTSKAEELLKKGENQNSISGKKMQSLIQLSCSYGNFDMFKLLLLYKADLYYRDYEKMGILHYAIEGQNYEMCDYIIDVLKYNIDDSDIQNRNVFYWACCLGDISSIKYLLNKGANPDMCSSMGRSALSKSCWNGRSDIIQILIDYSNSSISAFKININQQDSNGRTPLHNAVWGEYGGRLGMKMSGVSSTDSPESAEILLLNSANKEIEDKEGYTPLMLATSTHGIESLKLLIAYGANVNHLNIYKATAVLESCKFGNFDSAFLLLNLCEDNAVKLNAIDTKGQDCLNYCIIRDNVEAFKTLYNYNIKLNQFLCDKNYAIRIDSNYINMLILDSVTYNSKNSLVYLLNLYIELCEKNTNTFDKINIENIINHVLVRSCVLSRIDMIYTIMHILSNSIEKNSNKYYTNNSYKYINLREEVVLLIAIILSDEEIVNKIKIFQESKIDFDNEFDVLKEYKNFQSNKYDFLLNTIESNKLNNNINNNSVKVNCYLIEYILYHYFSKCNLNISYNIVNILIIYNNLHILKDYTNKYNIFDKKIIIKDECNFTYNLKDTKISNLNNMLIEHLNIAICNKKRIASLSFNELWTTKLNHLLKNSLLYNILNSLSDIKQIHNLSNIIDISSLIINESFISKDNVLHVIFQLNKFEYLNYIFDIIMNAKKQVLKYYCSDYRKINDLDKDIIIKNHFNIVAYFLYNKNIDNLVPIDCGIKNKYYDCASSFINAYNIYVTNYNKLFKCNINIDLINIKYTVTPIIIEDNSQYITTSEDYKNYNINEFIKLKNNIKEVQKKDYKIQLNKPFFNLSNDFNINLKTKLHYIFEKLKTNTIADEFSYIKNNEEHLINDISIFNDNISTYYNYIIDNEEKLLNLISKLKTELVIGVDLEFHYIDNKQDAVICLIQLSSFEEAFVIDCLKLNCHLIENCIKIIFEDDNIVKVFHSFDSDLTFLASNYNIYPKNVFDTSKAYLILEKYILKEKKFKSVNPPSLNYLSKLLLNLDIDKSYQKCDWSLRPLTMNMLQYALNDAKLVVYMYYYYIGLFKYLINEYDNIFIDYNHNNIKYIKKIYNNKLLMLQSDLNSNSELSSLATQKEEYIDHNNVNSNKNVLEDGVSLLDNLNNLSSFITKTYENLKITILFKKESKKIMSLYKEPEVNVYQLMYSEVYMMSYNFINTQIKDRYFKIIIKR